MPRRDAWVEATWVTCRATGKRGYIHRREARRAAKRTGDGLNHYLCEDCGRWHAGHATAQQRAAYRERPREMPEGFYDRLRAGLEQAHREEDERG
jgi:hypothetical protein